jgi:hypothetical protein
MGSLTPVNPKIYETQIFGGDYPSFSSKVCRPVMIQFSIPFSFVCSGLPLFWTKGLTVYGTDFTN